MRYKINGYICTNFAGLMDSFESDIFYEIQDTAREYLTRGYFVEIIDNERGDRGLIDPDSYFSDLEAV